MPHTSVAHELASDLLKIAGHARLRVAGPSMAPTLRIGDTILVEKFAIISIDVGQIITFVRGDLLCTHRVVALAGSKVITRGDANVFDDPPVNRRDCLGRVIAVERHGKTLPDAALYRRLPTERMVCSLRWWRRFQHAIVNVNRSNSVRPRTT